MKNDDKQANWALRITLAAILLVVAWPLLSWDWLVDGKNIEVARYITLKIGGILGAYAVYLAVIRVKIMQQQQVSQSIAIAAQQLSSDVMSIRVLAIVSLGEIAIESNKKICQDIIDVLCGYIREKRPDDNKGNISPFTEDMQQIIKVLSAIQDKKFNYSRGHIDLSHTDLSSVDLSNMNLKSAILRKANLSGTNLSEADLSGADLSGADLSDADLLRADLLDVDLSDVIWFQTEQELFNRLNYRLSGTDQTKIWRVNAVKNLETVKNPPRAVIDEIERQKQAEQKPTADI